MGATYASITLRGASRERITAALKVRGAEAFVGPTRRGCTVVFEERSDRDPARARALAAELSGELGCAALAAHVQDDAALLLFLCRGGQVLDEYDSNPGLERGRAEPPAGGGTTLLCEVIGAADADLLAVRRALRVPAREEPYFFESARHADLAEALGLPGYAAGLGYEYFWEDRTDHLKAEVTPVGPATSAWEPPPAAPGDVPPRATRPLPHPVHGFHLALARGDADAVRAFFLPGPPELDDPRHGRVLGEAALEAYVAAMAAWMGGRSMSYTPVATLETPERIVAEGELRLTAPPAHLKLPVACVWDRPPGGAGPGFARLRIYHSLWPIDGVHRVRPPLLPVRDGLVLPPEVARYQAALAAGDVEGVMACFHDFATVREPSGGPYRHAGRTAVRAFYTALFSGGGGIPLGHCTATTDGGRTAVEYVVTRWGRAELPPQAGVAVYDRAPGEERLLAARIYDDADPPIPASGE